jgi:hypothetical protein
MVIHFHCKICSYGKSKTSQSDLSTGCSVLLDDSLNEKLLFFSIHAGLKSYVAHKMAPSTFLGRVV